MLPLRTFWRVAAVLALLPLGQPAAAQTAEPEPESIGFDNSPDDVDNQLAESDKRFDALFPIGPLDPIHRQWQDATRQLERTLGLELGLNYTVLYQDANASLPGSPSEAAVGDLDFFGRWNLVNRDGPFPGAVVFFTENRHRFTDIPPSGLGTAVGSLWGTTNAFSQQDYALTQLFWEQGSREDRVVSRLGKIDPQAIYDQSRFISANEAFLNQAFSTTLAMPLPTTGLGAALAISPVTNTYIVGGVHDANGDRTSFGDIDRGELFAAVEFGIAPGHGEPGAGLYHVTLWHSDAREVAGIPSGRGIALTLQQELGPDGRIVPFFRYSYGDGGATRVRQAIASGVGIEQPFGQNNDLIGLGFSWGQPVDRTLRDQYVLEAFYRIQITPRTNLTPDIQVILDPSDNLDEETLIIGGLRLRTLF